MNQDKPRIGVYVCMCGSNIAGTVDVPAVVDAASKFRNVVVARFNKYTCSGPGQLGIQDDIKNLNLNRIVVAACSPRMHERTWQAMVVKAGLNPYMLEVANLREQCSWTHPNEEVTTRKAIDLVASAVERVSWHIPLHPRAVPVTKAAMVVGGGIAGIQAALDIAHAGVPVYLVEKEPSLGGHMAQLDKTFPTLDCSACILTPKMVSAGSHPNITLMSYSEVEKVDGFLGNFTVTVKRKARYVDVNACTGCGDCSKVCPVEVPSEFETGLVQRTAVYRPFAQAVPSAFAIDKRGVAPCQNACPAGIHVQGYVALIAKGRYAEAYDLIHEQMPFPGVCGRVCHHPCEAACRRGEKDSPVAIESLKRFAADWALAHPNEVFRPKSTQRSKKQTLLGKKVAIVGSGPAALTAVRDLSLLGAICEIFEPSAEVGGLLLTFPTHRLPKKIVEQEITQIISAANVHVTLQSPVDLKSKDSSTKGFLANLQKEYDAIFVESFPKEDKALAETFAVNPLTFETSQEKVFAGGDATAVRMVVKLVEAGHRAVDSISRFLLNEDLSMGRVLQAEDISGIEYYSPEKWTFEPRQEMAHLDKEARASGEEADLGYSEIQALAEASRCLSCSVCSECMACVDACQAGAIHHEMKDEFVEVKVGSIILATGYDAWDPTPILEYGYGVYPEVYTGLEIERLSNSSGPTEGNIVTRNGETPKRVAILHCVGSRDEHHQPYCSRICCMYSLKLAHLIHEKTHAEVYNFYIDMRAFGKGYEEFYQRVQGEGVVFVRGRGAQVLPDGNRLVVRAEDTDLGRPMKLAVDMVVLATSMVPSQSSEKLAHALHISRDANGFFLEAHPKLRPVDSNTDGIFLAGTCQAPRDIPDTVTHASAAASQALGLLSQDFIEVEPTVAEVKKASCVACGLCVEVCPYGAVSMIDFQGRQIAQVNEALCKGCGLCVAGCRGKAITLRGYNDTQILTQIETLLQMGPVSHIDSQEVVE
jgi:heterodisulfide reductase subunit A-like polyferredoxin